MTGTEMTLRRYTGYFRSNIGRDAVYSVSAAGQIKLTYRINHRQRALLTTDDHEELGTMVNEVKHSLNDSLPGGRFYLNEFSDVLVPDGLGTAYWAGKYERRLEFDFDGQVISADAPDGLRPGDIWEGPHVGMKYTLAAGGRDIRYELKEGNIRTIEKLSEHMGVEPAARLSKRLARHKGDSGGAIYINEANYFFAPVTGHGELRFVYLGGLEESDAWFRPEEEFDF